MYAIIEACGRQYKVEEGMVVFFEKLNEEEGNTVTFDKVILVSDGDKVEVGNPVIQGAKVEGKVVANGRGKKILVFKYKPKKNERKTRGHRQDFTKVEITSIKSAKITSKADTKVEKTDNEKIDEKKVEDKNSSNEKEAKVEKK